MKTTRTFFRWALPAISCFGLALTLPAQPVPSFVESRMPDTNQASVTPQPLIQVVVNEGSVVVNGDSIKVFLNGEDIGAMVTSLPPQYTATYQVTTLLAPLSINQLKVIWSENLAGFKTNEWTFTVVDYKSIILTPPIYLETFDELDEGTLPDGWSVTNATTSINAGPNLDDARSDSYLDWVVISSSRLGSVHGSTRLNVAPVAVNGELLDALANGNLAYAESDVRSGNQVQVMFTRDYDLRRQTNIYISYHSIYEQNQDNIAAVEYSIDQGTNWLPAVYMLDGADIIRAGGNIDAVATMNTARSDQAYGQSYGSFIGAAISPALAPFISERVNDDKFESKRVEFIRLTMADNQQNVRFRFLQAGTASWYFGVDDFGIYSITNPIPPNITRQPDSQLASAGGDVQFNVLAIGDLPFRYQWKLNGANLLAQTNETLTLFDVRTNNVGDYSVVVRNLGGAVTSRVSRLEIFIGCINQGLVGHYKLDADAQDSSGRDNHGMVMGLAAFVPGLVGTGALQVTTFEDGSRADHVSLGQPTEPSDLLFGENSDFSIALWAKMETWRGDPAFISNKDWRSGGNLGFVLAADGDGHFQWNYREVSPNDRKDYDGPPGTFNGEVWRHVAVTFQRGGLARTYVDGVQVDSRSLVTGANPPTTIDSGLPINIGTDGTGAYTDNGNVNATNMLIDDVGIWRRILTAQEVLAIHSAGRAGQSLGSASTVKLKIVNNNRTLTVSGPPSGCSFVLESKERLSDPTWTPVAGVVNNSVTAPADRASRFYRLRQ